MRSCNKYCPLFVTVALLAGCSDAAKPAYVPSPEFVKSLDAPVSHVEHVSPAPSVPPPPVQGTWIDGWVDSFFKTHELHVSVNPKSYGEPQRIAGLTAEPSPGLSSVAHKPDTGPAGRPAVSTPAKNVLPPAPADLSRYTGLVLLSLPKHECAPCEEFKVLAAQEKFTNFRTVELSSRDDYAKWETDDVPVFVVLRNGVERTRLIGGFDGSLRAFRDILAIVNQATTTDDVMPKLYARDDTKK